MNRLLDKERLKLGVCYYPEHSEEMWREDLERMADVGIEVIRIAELHGQKSNHKRADLTIRFLTNFWIWWKRQK